MIGGDRYLNAYVDRRMQSIIEEWELATKNDLGDFTRRLGAAEEEIPRLKASGATASKKLAELEARAKNLKERM
jgi:hypothetical protein